MNLDLRVMKERHRFTINEKDDCTVIALATVTGISYSSAHRFAEEAGRKFRKPFRTWSLLNHVANAGIMFRRVPLTWNGRPVNKMTVGGFARTIGKTGRFYAVKSGHAFSVIDGEVFNQKSERDFVIYAYEYIENQV